MIEFILECEGQSVVLPVNPSEIRIEREGSNEIIDIVALGNVVVQGKPKLATVSIESFFPRQDILGNQISLSSLLNQILPTNTTIQTITSTFFSATATATMQYVNFINKIWQTKKPIKFIMTELSRENMVMAIQNFWYEERAGEEGDIYYNLNLIEAPPYGAKKVNMNPDGTALPPQQPRQEVNKPAAKQTLTMQQGDTMTTIGKRITGDTDSWKLIYRDNKTIFGNNPNMSVPGTIINIPKEWL